MTNGDQLSAEEYVMRGRDRDSIDTFGKIEDFTAAIRIKPDFADAYYLRGIAQFSVGHRDIAIADYSEAIRIKPDFADAYYMRGIARFQVQGNLDEAIADYSEAIRVAPDNAGLYHFVRAGAHKLRGNFNEALADYSEAIRLNPNEFRGYSMRAEVRYQLEEFNAAIEDYNEAILRKPGITRLLIRRGEVFFSSKEFARAQSDFNSYLNVYPDSSAALAGLAVSLHAGGRVAEAKARWQQLVDLNRDFLDAGLIGKLHEWRPELIEEARKLIATL